MPGTLHIFCPDCLADNAVAPGTIAPACKACGAHLQPAIAAGCTAAKLQRFATPADLPLLVYFHAPGCTPCTLMAPVIDRVAKQLRESLGFLKIDARQEHELAADCGVSSVPCIVLLAEGREVRRFCGAMDRNSLARWITGAAASAG